MKEEEKKTGFMSNGYSYQPLDTVKDGFWNRTLGSVGSALGGTLGWEMGLAGAVAGSVLGEEAGRELGNAIDNAETVEKNVNTFVQEINDWRSWNEVKGQMGGGKMEF